ncbi:hypothetical protein [Streptomyces sp. NPDC059262]|uniref:hypothetical protein n=1 Tax=Streptomyces sp. NPDC059262 TaxID=3346797 RepID=UPI00369F3866
MEQKVPAEPFTTTVSAFVRGVTALWRNNGRTGSLTVPGAHTERLEDGKVRSVPENSNRGRGKLTADRLQALAVEELENEVPVEETITWE